MAASGTVFRGSAVRAVALRQAAAAMALAAALAVSMALPAAAAPPDTFRVPLDEEFVDEGASADCGFMVTGRILIGSQRIWQGVRRALTDPVERARQEVSRSFTAIQRQAIGALRAMGFRPSEARALVRLTERGGAEGASARSIAGARSRGERIDPRVLGRLEAHGAGSSARGSAAASD